MLPVSMHLVGFSKQKVKLVEVDFFFFFSCNTVLSLHVTVGLNKQCYSYSIDTPRKCK